MGTMSQKEAVYMAVINVTGFNGDGSVAISKEQRAQVNLILFEGFRSGGIQLDREFDDAELKAYVSGLQSNWLRKDKRLNGGIVYTAKNPGSRASHSDPELKALHNLMKTLTTPEDKAEVQTYITAKVAEINAAKIKTVVDFSALPADLAAKFAK